MEIAGSIALVTGANRGMGRHFVTQLLDRGAAKVYATARTPETITSRRPGVVALPLDITDPASITTAAATATDVTLIVNNAGISTRTNLVTGDLPAIHREIETNYFGPLHVIRAFAPTLGRNGGGAILTMLSALSWMSHDGANAYAAAKAAAWSLTNGVRLELASQGTLVSGLFVGSVDTDMMAGWDVPKSDPAAVVRTALDGLAAGRLEILADAGTVALKAALSQDPRALYPQLSTLGTT
ncbi:SDR family oxidoreductase [Parafrankia discariae]|uniref:SDR family oxidoreductase n=1 Tax=Parafrankia discariae TaxID=365528 RepID=UPI00037D0D7E|nr:SDR family oxidoreductase [Parafrankia discariae]